MAIALRAVGPPAPHVGEATGVMVRTYRHPIPHP